MAGIRDAFDASISASSLIDPVDAAIVAAGRALADQIDFAVDNLTGQDVTKALYLMPHLVNVLREMYATPKSRKEAGLGQEAAGGKLAAVRDLRHRAAPTKKRAG